MTFRELGHEFSVRISKNYTKPEAEMLFYIFLEYQCGISKFEAKKNLEEVANPDIQNYYEGIINRLQTGEPYQYILGETYFYGEKFHVNNQVLIPRPETEELVEFALSKLKEKYTATEKFSVLEIGTGSGIIAILLKKYFPNAEITAVDISEGALDVAKKNADFHSVTINFKKADFLKDAIPGAYDVIISNPPYIGQDEIPEIENSVQNFEPRNALFSPKKDPLIFYRKIVDFSKNHLCNDGFIFIEINQKLGKKTLNLYSEFSESDLIKDISGNDRIIFVRK